MLHLKNMEEERQRWISSSIITQVLEKFDKSPAHRIQLQMANNQIVQNLNFEIVEWKSAIQNQKYAFVKREDAPIVFATFLFVFLWDQYTLFREVTHFKGNHFGVTFVMGTNFISQEDTQASEVSSLTYRRMMGTSFISQEDGVFPRAQMMKE